MNNFNNKTTAKVVRAVEKSGENGAYYEMKVLPIVYGWNFETDEPTISIGAAIDITTPSVIEGINLSVDVSKLKEITFTERPNRDKRFLNPTRFLQSWSYNTGEVVDINDIVTFSNNLSSSTDIDLDADF